MAGKPVRLGVVTSRRNIVTVPYLLPAYTGTKRIELLAERRSEVKRASEPAYETASWPGHFHRLKHKNIAWPSSHFSLSCTRFDPFFSVLCTTASPTPPPFHASAARRPFPHTEFQYGGTEYYAQ
jgi:hypothetical protein